MLGIDNPTTLISVNNLGTYLADQGKYEKAEMMYRRASTGERVLGVDHPFTLTSARNLANLVARMSQVEVGHLSLLPAP